MPDLMADRLKVISIDERQVIPMYGTAKWWRTKGGKLILIEDMTDKHLINTIKFLKRQIDGSIHDEFAYDNVIAMENELKRRNIHE